MPNLSLANLFLISTACLLFGCSDVMLSGPNDGEPDEEPQFPEFDGASLELIAPLSGDILLLDEEVGFEAVVRNAEGDEMDFDAISWSTDLDEDFAAEGRSVSALLEAGIHSITATAELPNGDRLQSTMGGVRVQGLHTGIYAGSLIMELNGEFQGTPITTNCAGALDFEVDMNGELILGSGECALNLVILGSIDVSYDVSGDIEDNEAGGAVTLDTGFLPLDLDWEGGFEGEDELVGSFGGSLLMFEMQGSINARRLSPYINP